MRPCRFRQGMMRGAGVVTLVMKVVNKAGMQLKRYQQQRTGYTIRHTEDYVKPAPFQLRDWTPPAGYAMDEVRLPGCRAFWLERTDAAGEGDADAAASAAAAGSAGSSDAAPGSSPWAIYQLHGGGYIDDFNRTYCRTAVHYSKLAAGAGVLSLDYRTAPKNVHPAALVDALDGYDWLLGGGYAPGHIIVCGDSSGAGLAISLCMKLRELGRAQPAALVLSSPWTDLPGEGETHSTKLGEDICFGCYDPSNAPDYSSTLAYGRGCDLHDPYLSPSYGTFEDLPPMLIQTGENETLLSDSVTVAEKTNKAGGDARLIVYPQMFHTFYVMAPWLAQSRLAWEQVGFFMREVMRRRG